jgi:hypothetical protein
MNNDIKVTGIVDHEDGSATVTLDLSPETYHKIFEYGFLNFPGIYAWPHGTAIDRRQTMGRFRRLMGCGYKQ